MINITKKIISTITLLAGMAGMILSAMQPGVVVETSRDIDVLFGIEAVAVSSVNPAIYSITIVLAFLVCSVSCAMCYFSYPRKVSDNQELSSTPGEGLAQAYTVLTASGEIAEDNDPGKTVLLADADDSSTEVL